MLVVATTDAGVRRVRARLEALGARPTDVVAPSETRRIVLATTCDVLEAERLAVVLRAEGEPAVARPDGGARLEAWRRHTHPLRFGDRLSVSFAWSEHERHALPGLVELGPGGWGHGDHPTTALVIDQLRRRIAGGESVLDVGCGSGVLALCALRLGASRACAVDIDADAIAATRRNAVLNDMVDRIDATPVPLGEIGGRFDIVLANIGRAALVALAPELVRLVAPDGHLVVSGIAPSQCDPVAGFLQPLVEGERRTCGEWAAVVLSGRR